jgi:hypothetical protein
MFGRDRTVASLPVHVPADDRDAAVALIDSWIGDAHHSIRDNLATMADPLGEPRGFEVVGFEVGRVHSWLCYGLHERAVEVGQTLHLTQYGLLTSIGEALEPSAARPTPKETPPPAGCSRSRGCPYSSPNADRRWGIDLKLRVKARPPDELNVLAATHLPVSELVGAIVAAGLTIDAVMEAGEPTPDILSTQVAPGSASSRHPVRLAVTARLHRRGQILSLRTRCATVDLELVAVVVLTPDHPLGGVRFLVGGRPHRRFCRHDRMIAYLHNPEDLLGLPLRGHSRTPARVSTR